IMDINKPRLDLDELERKNSINYKYCEHCGAAIPRSAEFACCAKCQETILFHEVKNYIRENNVNEFQVAERFNIPLRLVKQWMRELRIEYVNPNRGPKLF
ncbi:MAG: hypothetical protein J6I97_01865, partial [Agathobacter sp.]|nr:hypothetical protein [Agathobacter sp.]